MPSSRTEANGPSPASESLLPEAMRVFRDAGAEINRLGPDTSLTEALQLIAATVVRLIGADPEDGVEAVIYTYDAALGRFDPQSRVSAGEVGEPLVGDVPRPVGVGATALARRSRVLSYEETDISFHPLKYKAGIRTAACYPLLVAGTPVGALYIDLRSARRFTDEELLVLDTFVHLAAVAIYNTRQFEGINRSLRSKVEQLEALRRAEQVISSQLSLDDTLQEILRSALSLTQAEFGSFRLLNKQKRLLELRAKAGEWSANADQTPFPLDDTHSVVGWVGVNHRPLLLANLKAAPWTQIYRPLNDKMQSELAVPLLGPGGGLEGVLNVESLRLAAFDADDRRVLESLATQAVIAIQEAKVLDAMVDVTGQLVMRSPQELFGLILEYACDLLNVPHGAVWEWDRKDSDSLTLRAATGGFPPRYRVPVEGSLLGETVLHRRPATSVNMLRDPRIQRRELMHKMGWVSALVVPLVARDETTRGALGVYSTEMRVFSDREVRLLTMLANYAAVAMQEAEAVARMKAAEERQAVAETFAVLGDVAANLLHRVNNLVGAIPARIQGLEEKRPAVMQDDYTVTQLREIEESARTAMDAARETLTHLRPIRLRPTPVAPCWEAALARAPRVPELAVRAQDLTDLPPVLAGRQQLTLLFLNLIENAIDAIEGPKGEIVLTARVVQDEYAEDRTWVELRLSDTGPGVPDELREKIFEPEFSTKRSPKKLGFGLWWVKTMVHRCGGTIALAETQERGTTFIIRLRGSAGETTDDLD